MERRPVLRITIYADGANAESLHAEVDIGPPVDGMDGEVVAGALTAMLGDLAAGLDRVWATYRVVHADVLNPN